MFTVLRFAVSPVKIASFTVVAGEAHGMKNKYVCF